MRLVWSLACFMLVLHHSYAPPVTSEKPKEPDSEIKDDLEIYMEYHRYLKEVVQALESDPDFRERLEKADEDDVRSGKIAEQLDFVDHNVRTKLDEIKRQELERLRHLASQVQHQGYTLSEGYVKVGEKSPSNEHLDHHNPHTFEIEDLKKLIKKTTADLEAADKQRKKEFKEYEMQKEFEKHQKLENLDETQKKEYMENIKKDDEAKKHHAPLHHPGSKQQLEEVWEKQDHMDQQFDPKVFFMMHDVDGNGVWDADEVKALFIKELDKLYGPAGPNKDRHERAEEMERMREHVFQENDKNRDGLIDFNEFMMETQKADFNQDEGWKSIDENEIYTQQEYQEYERRRLDELRFLQQRGLVDAHGRPIPGAQHQIRQAHQEYLAYQQQAYHQQMQGQQYHAQGQVPLSQGQAPIPKQSPQNLQQVPTNGQFAEYHALPVSQGQYQNHQDQGQIPQQPQMANMNQGQVQQGYQQAQQMPQLGQNPQMPQFGQNSQIPQMGQNQQMPQTGQNSQMPQQGQNSQMPQHGQNSQMPQMGQNPQMPQLGQNQQMPQPGQNSQMPQVGQNPQTLQMGQNPQMPQLGQNPPGQGQNQGQPAQTQNQVPAANPVDKH